MNVLMQSGCLLISTDKPTRRFRGGNMIKFSELTKDQQQAMADFLWKENKRHENDILRGENELRIIKKYYGITPRNVYIGQWIEVD